MHQLNKATRAPVSSAQWREAFEAKRSTGSSFGSFGFSLKRTFHRFVYFFIDRFLSLSRTNDSKMSRYISFVSGFFGSHVTEKRPVSIEKRKFEEILDIFVFRDASRKTGFGKFW